MVSIVTMEAPDAGFRGRIYFEGKDGQCADLAWN
jgi:hypothetical protein